MTRVTDKQMIQNDIQHVLSLQFNEPVSCYFPDTLFRSYLRHMIEACPHTYATFSNDDISDYIFLMTASIEDLLSLLNYTQLDILCMTYWKEYTINLRESAAKTWHCFDLQSIQKAFYDFYENQSGIVLNEMQKQELLGRLLSRKQTKTRIDCLTRKTYTTEETT